MHYRLRHVLPLLALLAAACDSPLAPGTAGPPVFAAVIDDQPWPPADRAAVFAAAIVAPGTLTLAAAIRDEHGITMQLLGMSIPVFQGARRYELTTGADAPWALVRRRGDTGTAIFVTSAGRDDYIQITAIDTVARVVAGTFAFTVRGTGPDAKALRVSGGTFRVPYTSGAADGKNRGLELSRMPESAGQPAWILAGYP